LSAYKKIIFRALDMGRNASLLWAFLSVLRGVQLQYVYFIFLNNERILCL